MQPSATFIASLLFSASVACTAVNAILVRVLTNGGMDAFEIAFFRNLFGLLFMAPWLLRTGIGSMRTRRPGLHLLRALSNLCTMVAFFYAIALLPVADVVALNFIAPIFASVGAVLVLGEVMARRRWAATLLGFLGALVIVRPGFETVSPALLLALLAAAAWACMQLLTKVLTRNEPAATIVTLNLLLVTPVSLLPLLLVWRVPSGFELAMMLTHGVLGALNQICVARAFRLADASLLMPLDFLRLPFVAGLAYLLFAQAPDLWTWLGAGLIFAASVYVTQPRREGRGGR